jgi:hypothetical protein
VLLYIVKHAGLFIQRIRYETKSLTIPVLYSWCCNILSTDHTLETHTFEKHGHTLNALFSNTYVLCMRIKYTLSNTQKVCVKIVCLSVCVCV